MDLTAKSRLLNVIYFTTVNENIMKTRQTLRNVEHEKLFTNRSSSKAPYPQFGHKEQRFKFPNECFLVTELQVADLQLLRLEIWYDDNDSQNDSFLGDRFLLH